MSMTVQAAGRRLASNGPLDLAIPEWSKGIGSVIGIAESPDLIGEVRVQPISIHPDDRGYFLEVQRFGRGLAQNFAAATSQVSAALNYAGAVKAFHYHLHQTDCWTPSKGLLQVALVDLRLGSPTFGRRQHIQGAAHKVGSGSGLVSAASAAHNASACAPKRRIQNWPCW